MLWNKDDLAMSLRYEASAKAAEQIGVKVQPLGVREPNDFDDAFTAMNREPPDAILMVSEFADAAQSKARHRFRRGTDGYRRSMRRKYIARDGGLMSYGADERESFERAATLVQRIFEGAKPADLPCGTA